MYSIPRDQILARLRLDNPWWGGGAAAAFTRWRARPYRSLFQPLLADRRVRRAVVLMGPRRVGKTVLLHHCAQALLQQGLPSNRICYVSVDHPLYLGLSLERLLDLYAEATGVDPASDECFVFYDEIQYLKGWEVHLKALVDSHPNVRFVASGSAAAALRLQSAESGAGRFTDFLLPPLTFHEYLALASEDDLVSAALEALQGLPVPPDDLDRLNDRFIDYVNFGGYPEVALSPAIQSDPGRFVKSDIIDKVLLRDLPSLYGIEDIQELNGLFTSLAFNTAQEVTLEALARNAGISKPTIKRYIDYLEAAFLLRVIHRVDQRARRFRRANFFKVYLTNPSMRTALFAAVAADDPAMGWLVETAAFSQWFHHERHFRLHYARWPAGEIDVVSLGPDQRVRWAVEVKWSDRWAGRPELLRQALAFCRRNDVPTLVVTTRTRSVSLRHEGVDLRYVPAALYCFNVGYSIVEGQLGARQLSLW